MRTAKKFFKLFLVVLGKFDVVINILHVVKLVKLVKHFLKRFKLVPVESDIVLRTHFY